MEPVTTLTLAGLAVAACEKLIENLVDSTYESAKNKLNIEKNDLKLEITRSFTAYLKRAEFDYSFLNTLVFPNQPKNIKNLYVPLTIKTDSQKEQKKYLVNGWVQSLYEDFNRILLVDSAGMGKSTLLKFIFLSTLSTCPKIPVLIELRRLSSSRKIVDLIYEALCGLKSKVDKNYFIQMLEAGQFYFFLDGYDEIGKDIKDEVSEDLHQFISRASNNWFLMSSREENGLAAFSSFQRFSILELTETQAYQLIAKYGENSIVSKNLVSTLKKSKSTMGVKEFLKNPLLVSLLFKAYDSKNHIPIRKHIFYRQVFDALYDSHDISKERGSYVREKATNLDIDSFHRVMRGLGYLCYRESKLEFSKDDLILFIERASKIFADLKFSPSSLIEDITQNVPLFVKDGLYYRWSHKSLQEYFAAQFILIDSKDRQDSILLTLLDFNQISGHFNLLTLYGDMDPRGFRFGVVKPLIAKLLSNFKEPKYARENIESAEFEIRMDLENTWTFMFLHSLTYKEVLLRPPPGKTELDIIPRVEVHIRVAEAIMNKIIPSTQNYGSNLTRANDYLVYGKIKFPRSVGDLLFTWDPTLCHKEYPGYIELPTNSNQKFGVEIINDNLDSIYNQPSNFNNTSTFLKRLMRGDKVLKFSLLREKLNEIDEEITNIKDFF